jgi:hypothetical protein
MQPQYAFAVEKNLRLGSLTFPLNFVIRMGT